MINVLVFPCGSEIGLEIHNCLYQQKDINLFGASSVDDNGRFVYEKYLEVPFIDDAEFLSSMRKIVKDYHIDYIMPAMDVAITALKRNEHDLGCVVLASPKETIDIISRKSTTYDHFRSLIRVPKYSTGLPAFSKPDIGSSSRGTMMIDSNVALKYSMEKYPTNIHLEYLPGEEFTVDCFSDKTGKLLFSSARIRKKVSNGISISTTLWTDPKIDKIANTINDNLKLTGPWFFQLKKDKNDEYCLLEIASRFAGSSVINRLHGVNFAYLNILKEYGDVKIDFNRFDIQIGRSLNTKTIIDLQYDNVYIDLDDTIIINDNVNTKAMEFLYRCVNKNVNIFLITKHKKNVRETLAKHRINADLFDDIIHLEQDDDKSRYIKEHSIFIDDSFSERMNVKAKLGIPTISIENIEHL